MKQFFEEYIYWEDYINGMYDLPNKKDEQKYIFFAIKVLTNNDLFLNACKDVLKNWTVSSKVNLTNKNYNRKAWLGQASCNFKYNVPEICTRMAWGKLTLEQKNKANNIAEQVINSFELNYEKKDPELYN